MKKLIKMILVLFIIISCFVGDVMAGMTEVKNGPTVVINQDDPSRIQTPIDDFMYFVPLVSPVFVECLISKKNSQLVKILSCNVIQDDRCFRASCDFRVTGRGKYVTKFVPDALIKNTLLDRPTTKELTNLLDYIEIDGSAYCSFKMKGIIKNGKKIVTEVRVKFNCRDSKSPVTVALYSVKNENRKFDYKKRYDVTVARINELAFKKCNTIPRMEIVLDSVGSGKVADSLWAVAKGFIANFFIRPIEVDAVGNQSVLDFCQAIISNEPNFTFPQAANLISKKDI